MKTKRGSPTDKKQGQVPPEPNNRNEEREEAIDYTKGVETLRFFRKPDGSYDFERLRERGRNAIRDFVNDPIIQKEFGVRKTAGEAAPQVFSNRDMDLIYDGLGFIETIVATSVFKIPGDIAKEAFTYDALEKDKLCEPTRNVVNKYASDFLVRYKDEIGLGILLLSVTAAKINHAKMLMDMRAKETRHREFLQGDNGATQNIASPADSPAPPAPTPIRPTTVDTVREKVDSISSDPLQ